jgi:hypothetical protein
MYTREELCSVNVVKRVDFRKRMEISSDEFQNRLYKASEKRMHAQILADSAPDCSFLIRAPGSERSFTIGIGASKQTRQLYKEEDACNLTPSPVRTVLLRTSNEPISTILSPDFTVNTAAGVDLHKSSEGGVLYTTAGSGALRKATFGGTVSRSMEGGVSLIKSEARALKQNRKSWDDLNGILKARIGNGGLFGSHSRDGGSKSRSPEQAAPQEAKSWLSDLSAPDRTTKSYMRNTLISETHRQAHTERARQRGEPANWPWWKQKPLEPDEPIPVPLSTGDPTYSPEVLRSRPLARRRAHLRLPPCARRACLARGGGGGAAYLRNRARNQPPCSTCATRPPPSRCAPRPLTRPRAPPPSPAPPHSSAR